MSALDEFAALYQKEVATKFNPQIHDLYAKYAHQIGDTSLYFTSIRHQGKLIAGHTFKYNPSMR
jgi:hypothetical protein